MKYKTYIQSLQHSILRESRYLQNIGERITEAESDMRNATFIDAMIALVFNMGNGQNINNTAKRIIEIAAMLEAPAHFVEAQPRGKAAFKIGSEWIKQKEKHK